MKTATMLLEQAQVVHTPSLREVLGSLGREPFSKTAVAAYMQEQLELVWWKVSRLAYFFGKHPKAWEKAQKMPRMLGVVGIAVTLAPLIILAIIDLTASNHDPAIQHVIDACVLVAITGMIVWICGLVVKSQIRSWQRWAFDSHWIRERYLLPPEDMPASGKRLFEQIQRASPDTIFYIHRLHEDPLLEVVYNPDNNIAESYYIYGWNGRKEWFQIAGKIHEIALPQ